MKFKYTTEILMEEKPKYPKILIMPFNRGLGPVEKLELDKVIRLLREGNFYKPPYWCPPWIMVWSVSDGKERRYEIEVYN